MSRRAGVIEIQANGRVYDAAGDFDFNPGHPITEALLGPSGSQGHKEMPQTACIEGAIRDSKDLDIDTLYLLRDATVTLKLANGKIFMLSEARWASEGKINTGSAEIEARFEGERGDIIKA